MQYGFHVSKSAFIVPCFVPSCNCPVGRQESIRPEKCDTQENNIDIPAKKWHNKFQNFIGYIEVWGFFMDILSLLGIAVGLSMDAFAVSIATGAAAHPLRWQTSLRMAAAFGLFQAMMPCIGWGIGRVGEGFITQVDHWIALLLLGYLGGKMIWDSRKKDEEHTSGSLPWKRLFALAVATSIDALATGILLPSAVGAYTVWLMLASVGTIGVITFGFSFGGAYLGKRFGSLLSSKAELVGGLVLIAIGRKIFIEHMFF